jgi:hypothetical protein
MSLRHLTDQAARANCSSAILWVAPFSESEQLGSHVRPPELLSKPISPVDVYVYVVNSITLDRNFLGNFVVLMLSCNTLAVCFVHDFPSRSMIITEWW